jgi:hypothetical protein
VGDAPFRLVFTDADWTISPDGITCQIIITPTQHRKGLRPYIAECFITQDDIAVSAIYDCSRQMDGSIQITRLTPAQGEIIIERGT